jgi:hypothetical protein
VIVVDREINSAGAACTAPAHFWKGEQMSRTIEVIRRRNKLEDRLKASAEVVIAAMREGLVMHQHHEWFGSMWFLSNGERIKDEVAQIVIKAPAVTGGGDALPLGDGTLSQTFTYAK